MKATSVTWRRTFPDSAPGTDGVLADAADHAGPRKWLTDHSLGVKGLTRARFRSTGIEREPACLRLAVHAKPHCLSLPQTRPPVN